MSRARNIAILLDGNGDVNTSALDNATTSLSDLGVTATATEINHVDGVTSNVQTQIDGKQNPLTAGTDYQTPLVAGQHYQTPLTAGTDYQTPLTAGQHYLTPTGDASQLTNLPAGYTDSDTAAYLSNNGYDTATNIVASITDSAPATMDTLNELAAALGDDANFATTVTNSLAGKANLTGATFTGAVVLPSGANDPASGSAGELFFNTATGAFKFNDGSGWKKISATVPKINSVSGSIYNGIATTLTLTGEGFLQSNLEVNIYDTGIGVDETVTVTPSSDTSASVNVPSGIYNNAQGGNSFNIKVTNSDGATSTAFSKAVSSLPTGGTITFSGGYRYHTFTSSGTFNTQGSSYSCDYVVVAGGASGGGGTNYYHGGGGGAGGMIEYTGVNLNGSYSASIGSGGGTRSNGSNSSFNGNTATGGGAGGNEYGANHGGNSGGSGGGGTWNSNGGAGTSGQGYAGGNGQGGGPYAAGGGGGKSQDGTNGTSSAGGDGGDGKQWLNGTYYAGGGGGTPTGAPTIGYGGTGGGGNGASNAQNNGTANTGGGGGGTDRGGANPGNGGSGIVVIRYAV